MNEKFEYEPQVIELYFRKGHFCEENNSCGHIIFFDVYSEKYVEDIPEYGQEIKSCGKLIRPMWRRYIQVWSQRELVSKIGESK